MSVEVHSQLSLKKSIIYCCIRLIHSTETQPSLKKSNFYCLLQSTDTQLTSRFFQLLCIPVALNIPTHIMVWHDHNFSHNILYIAQLTPFLKQSEFFVAVEFLNSS